MQLVRSIADLIADIWRDARRLLLVLWLCRVSTASATLALILAFLPQVQDLYTELSYYSRPTLDEQINTVGFWAGFYALAFLWAFTVHYCARTVLSFETWPLKQSNEEEYSYWIEAVPRYLGWISILAIFLGQINALKNLQIDDQALATGAASAYTLPMIIIFAAIIFIQTITRRLGRTALIISIIAILYWLNTAYDIYFNAPLAENLRLQLLHNIALPVVTILFGCVFYLFVAERRRLLKWLAIGLPWPHQQMLKLTAMLASWFPVQIRPMHNAETRDLAPRFLPFKKHGLFHFEAPSENVRGLMLGLFSLTIIMLLWLTFAISDPANPPFGLRRALLLPVLLGIWVPLLTTITFLSNQIRFPLLTSFVILGVSMSWFLGDNHDIELAAPLVEPQRENPVKTYSDKLPLKAAIELWMKQHNCLTTPRACPPPIIIAASGGASRSAFFTTSVIGELIDKPGLFWPSKIAAKDVPVTPEEVTKRIFAISSVSGGSLGSAIFASTLKAQQASLFQNAGRYQDQGIRKSPCLPAPLRRDKLLFSVPEDSAKKATYPINWKNCLQAMAAGDFLSPAMISFAFRDNLALSSFIGLITGTDRAKSLERAWSERIAKLTGRESLEQPLLSFKPNEQNWMPILLLNGTSVSTGKRLIATPLESQYNPENKIAFAPYLAASANEDSRAYHKAKTPIFADSLDLHALLSKETPGTNGWSSRSGPKGPALDISLAKAVSLSARFPLISPHGNLRDREGNIIDRVVDGGYFDNSGMLTALEISNAIEALTNNALKPILVQISNHPVSLDEVSEETPAERKKSPARLSDDDLLTASVKTSLKLKPKRRGFRCPEQSFQNHRQLIAQRQLLPELRAVTSALLNARVARGSHAIARAALQQGDRFIHFQVAGIKDEVGANKKLSMSWWLSKSVQNALNNQIKWRRKNEGAPKSSLTMNLNPAFCAIRKFRKAHYTHWKNKSKTATRQPVFHPSKRFDQTPTFVRP